MRDAIDFRTAFARHVGRGRKWSVCAVASELDLSDSLVEKWLSGRREPNASQLQQLFTLLGTPFINDFLPGHFARQVSGEPACPRKMMTRATVAAHRLAEAAEDDHFSVTELYEITGHFADCADYSMRLRPGAL